MVYYSLAIGHHLGVIGYAPLLQHDSDG
ncbi:hypothetical protein ACUOCP_20540 [Escherichia sp. R-CC3]